MVQVIPEIWLSEREGDGDGDDAKMISHARNEMESIFAPTAVGA